MTRFSGLATLSLVLGCEAPYLPPDDGGGHEGGSGAAGAGGHGGGEDVGPAVAFPQSIAGIMHANPDVYAEVPIRVAVDGSASSVEVTVGGDTYEATDDDGDGTWVALANLAGRPEGSVTVRARATPQGLGSTLEAELVLSRGGVKFTDFAEVGSAGTPRLLRHEGNLYVTYTDRSEGEAEAWLQRIDGAYRPLGERLRLADAPGATLYARTVLGGDVVGTLYQGLGSPYSTHFRAVDLEGNEVVASLDLDLPDSGAYSGGDIAFDGTHFLVAFKVVDAEAQKLLFARVDPATGDVTGPEVLTTSGHDDPDGQFLGFSPVSIEPSGGGAVVTFTRDRYSAPLDLSIPITQYVTVAEDGSVVEQGDLTNAAYHFHREARLSTVHGDIVAIFSTVDLLDPSPTLPYLFYAKRAEPDGTFATGSGNLVFDAVDDRDDPFLLEHPTEHAILAWTDHRSYTEEGLENGRVELYVAGFSEELETAEPVVFPHARFVAGLSELNGTLLGSNVALTWVDERHGQGIADPKPEVYLETAWF